MSTDDDEADQFREEEASDIEDGGTVLYEGQRRAKVYKMGGHYFHREKAYPSVGKVYYKCIGYNRLDCRARAESYIPAGDQPVVLTPRPGYEDHCHAENQSYGPFLQMRQEVIELCMAQDKTTSLQNIFTAYKKQAERRDKGAASLLRFDCIQRAVQYRRFKAGHPSKCPKTFEDANDLLTHPDTSYLGRTKDDKQEFYQGMVGDADEESMVFASKRCLNIVKRDMIVASDATYKLTPRLMGALQVLILSVLAFGITLPIAFVVMPRKTTEAYKAVFVKLRELGLDVHEVITDWEDGERKGWKEAYNRRGRALIVWGCIWHYMRAIYRKAREFGLSQYWISTGKTTKATEQASLLLRLCCLLPRLPGNRIAKAHDDLVTQELPKVRPDEVQFNCMRFLNYLRGEWVDRPDVDEVSVYNRHVYVTSGLESVNRSMNREVKDKHPGFNKFLRIIKEKEEKTYEDYKNIRFSGKKTNGRSKHERKSTSDIQRDTDITAAAECLKCTDNELMFLTLCQPTLREDFHTLQVYNDDDPIQPLTRNQVYGEEEGDLNPDDPEPQNNMLDDPEPQDNVDMERNAEEDEDRDRGNGEDTVENEEMVVGDDEEQMGVRYDDEDQVDAVMIEQNDGGEGNEVGPGENRRDAEMMVESGEEILSQTGAGRRQRLRRETQRTEKIRVKSDGQKARDKRRSKLKRKLKKAAKNKDLPSNAGQSGAEPGASK